MPHLHHAAVWETWVQFPVSWLPWDSRGCRDNELSVVGKGVPCVI